jgi:hypothetical protein
MRKPSETHTGLSIDGDATQKIPRWRRLAGLFNMGTNILPPGSERYWRNRVVTDSR